MSREIVNKICEALPGAEVSDPWGGGHDAWKVGGKMFACIGAITPGVSLKTDSIKTASLLIEMGAAVRAPYFHRSWIHLGWNKPQEELASRIRMSYAIVRKSLTRKAQALLKPFE